MKRSLKYRHDAPMTRGTNLEKAHLSNLRLVVEELRTGSALSRADLARRLGLTSQTIGNLVNRLIEEGVIRETGRRSSVRGQPARELAVNPGGACTLGVHLDRDRFMAVLCDLSGQVLAQKQGLWGPDEAPDQVLSRVSAEVQNLLGSRPRSLRFWGGGLACPGPLTPEGVLEHPTHFPGWDGVNLRQFFIQAAGTPVWIENDARAAAVGELRYGGGRMRDHFLFLYYGGGLGMGIVQHRELFRGPGGRAGEVAHTGGRPEDPPCACGRRGCWETKASLPVIREALGQNGIPWPGPDGLDFLAQEPNSVLREVFRTQARSLAPLIESSLALLDLKTVFLGGRLGRFCHSLFAGELGRLLPEIEVLAAELPQGAALGAAALPGYPGD